MKKLGTLIYIAVGIFTLGLLGNSQAVSNFGSAFFPANVAITGGSISGVSASVTTLAASSTISGTGFTAFMASPPAVGYGSTTPEPVATTLITRQLENGSQAVTIGACTGTTGSGTFNCPGGNTAGTGAQGICFTTGGNQCTLTSGLISITTGSAAGAGDIVEVITNGTAPAHALNCQLTGGGPSGTLPLTSAGVITIDQTSLTNGQFQIASLSAPSSSHQYLVFYHCEE